jgi:hypothetical protein
VEACGHAFAAVGVAGCGVDTAAAGVYRVTFRVVNSAGGDPAAVNFKDPCFIETPVDF